MDPRLFQQEELYAGPRHRINYFAWTVAILLLTGFALAAWLGSFYIFAQPERPDSYRILQRLHKIEQPKRFELTAAPAGEFLNAKQLYDRYVAMGSAELAKANAELARNYIRNYLRVPGLVPYVIGLYAIIEARELEPNDVFTSGMVALTNAVDHGELLMEHVYPAEAAAVPLIKQTLSVGLEIKLERTHDLSAVVHAERLADGRIMVTAIPLLYGTYTVTRGPGTFRLEPPLNLNLAGGWPLFKEDPRRKAELHYAMHRRSAGAGGQVPVATGLAPSGTLPPAQNELVRIEHAKPVETPVEAPLTTAKGVAKTTPRPKGMKLAKNQKPTPGPKASPAPTQPLIVEKPAIPGVAVATAGGTTPAPTPTPNAFGAPPSATRPPIVVATPAAPVVAQASPPPTATPVPVLPAQPVLPDASGNALASTAGGGNWKTFPPSRMPLGRLIGTSDLNDLADRGTVGERVYLKGQFVVNFSDANRAVLRPRTKLTDTVLHFGAGSSTRIIVEFPAGYRPPPQGATVSRDEARPYEITEVRKRGDGQLNVFVREIMQP
ncbi:MAG TPA: hypothetical protein VNY07_06710 [Chthoniobacterales bacterium]|jgi:hypothetical protein|nr:hypothetical protein [Chthoniobacterales bacterium]